MRGKRPVHARPVHAFYAPGHLSINVRTLAWPLRGVACLPAGRGTGARPATPSPRGLKADGPMHAQVRPARALPRERSKTWWGKRTVGNEVFHGERVSLRGAVVKFRTRPLGRAVHNFMLWAGNLSTAGDTANNPSATSQPEAEGERSEPRLIYS